MSARGHGLARNRSGIRFPFPTVTAAALLAGGTIWWSASAASARFIPRLALIVAIVSGVLSIAQLAIAAAVARDTNAYSPTEQVAQWIADLIRTLPWAELMTVATVALEALHAFRPWHTAVLAVALTSYLFAVHLAESGAGASVVRAQLPLLAAGAGLTALAVGAAALPALPVGPGAALIRVVATVIAVVVAGLVVPAWLGRGR